jgi:hypothetical protein
MKRWMLLGLLACACGGSDNNGTPDAGFPTGTGTITGTVNGQSLVVRDAVFGIDAAFMTLVMADRTHVCELLGGNTLPSGQTTVLGLALLNWVGGTTNVGPIVTGDYTWFDLPGIQTGGPTPSPGHYWNGAFAIPTSCDTAIASASTGGTVTVTQVGTTTGTHLQATLTNLTFDGGTLNGSADAVYCPNAKINPACGGISLLARPGNSE